MTTIKEFYDISLNKEEKDKLYEDYKENKHDFEEEFCKKTKLDRQDLKFLFFATSLQILRWVILNRVIKINTEKFGESIDTSERIDHNDKNMKSQVKQQQKIYKENYFEKNDEVKKSKKKYRSAMELVMTTKVPYDATNGAALFNLNLGGKYHRETTLGHDPLLGWIFGTINIITDTMTLNNFLSYDIDMRGLKIIGETSIFTVFQNAVESIVEDYKRLPAAIFAQGLHLSSDKYTKVGLPIPILGIFNPELVNRLYRQQYDYLCLLRDTKIVGKVAGKSILQGTLSVLIDMLITCVHELFYDSGKFPNKDLYEVKTRKILLYSNIISSSSNIVASKISGWQNLDIGGIANAVYRLFTDLNFIRKIKQEFVQERLMEKYQRKITSLDNEISNLMKELNIDSELATKLLNK